MSTRRQVLKSAAALAGGFYALGPRSFAVPAPAHEEDGAGLAGFETSDGRLFEYLDRGAKGDRAFVVHHGTPAPAPIYAPWEAAAAARLRLIAFSRSGYSKSARRGRKVPLIEGPSVKGAQ